VTSTELAREVVSALVESGVREVVVAPGSRNAPLSFAVYDAAAAGLVRLHTRIDERSAGFLALGLTKVGSQAAVICTSGTAVANLHPAMLEAAHAGVRLLAVTADRPTRLRGTGANQTTDQVGVFGPLVPYVDLGPADAAVARTALGLGDGPLHLNVQLDDPLVPSEAWDVRSLVEEGAPVPVTRPGEAAADAISLGPRTVVVAGDDAGPPARVLAEKAGWPLLAEPTSGSRTGDAAIRTYRLLLGGPLADEVERVVVFGHPTLSRPVMPSRVSSRSASRAPRPRKSGNTRDPCDVPRATMFGVLPPVDVGCSWAFSASFRAMTSGGAGLIDGGTPYCRIAAWAMRLKTGAEATPPV